MKDFIARHRDKIAGVLSCFDRLLFKGYLTGLMYPDGLDAFLSRRGLLLKDFKSFALEQSARIKAHAQELAAKQRRPYEHLRGYIRKEERARAIAKKDGVIEGLVCVFSEVEPCRTFRLLYGKGRPRLASDWRQCLYLFFYFIHPRFGLMHVRIQTWFPFEIQVYVNGHEWLARKLDRHGIKYRQIDNAFASIEDPARAQRFADQMAHEDWPRILDVFAREANPLLGDLLQAHRYYWVTSQSEYSTDIMFKSQSLLAPLYKNLLRHAALSLGAEDILTFLGRKLRGNFQGEVLNDLKRRFPGARVKHSMKDNWIKMYDKHGLILRIETVINHPYQFKIRRKGTRKGEPIVGWFPMCKGVCNLYRYAEVSLLANTRYLDALAVVDDPKPAYESLATACKRLRLNGRSVPALNPLSPDDRKLFAAINRGEYAVTGFRNRDLRQHLFSPTNDRDDERRRASRVSRLLRVLHSHGLIAKISHTRRWRMSKPGQHLISAVVTFCDEYFPKKLAS